MPLTTGEREIIEIPDSPTAHPQFIEISDDEVEVIELLDYQGKLAVRQIRSFQTIYFGPVQLSDHFLAKQIKPPRIPPIQPAYVPKADGNPESMKSELADLYTPHDAPMVSLGMAMHIQSSSSGEFNLGVVQGTSSISIFHVFTFSHNFDVPLLIWGTDQGHPAGEESCYDVLDRGLGEISREMEKDQSSMTRHTLEVQSQFQAQPKFTATENYMASMQSMEALQQGGTCTSPIAIIHHVCGSLRARVAASDFIK